MSIEIIDTLQYAVEYMCGETAASGFAIMGAQIVSRLCPRRVSEKKRETFIGACVTHIRKPALFSFDITDGVRESFRNTGMLDYSEAISMIPVSASLSDIEKEGMIVELQQHSPSSRPEYRVEILRDIGDIAIFMDEPSKDK